MHGAGGEQALCLSTCFPAPELSAPKQLDSGTSTDSSISSSLLEVKSAPTVTNARLNTLENDASTCLPCQQSEPLFRVSSNTGSRVGPRGRRYAAKVPGNCSPSTCLGSHLVPAAATPDSLRKQFYQQDMSETPSKTVRCGQRSRHLEEPRPLPQTPSPPQERDVNPPTSGSQTSSSVGVIRQKQQRPSVLRQLSQIASRQHHAPPGNSAAVSVCKEEVDAGQLSHSSSSSSSSSSPGQSCHVFSSRSDRPKQSVFDIRLHNSVPEQASALYVNRFCHWPGCDAVIEDFHSFLKHLRSEHSHSDRSMAQWKVQRDLVQHMESQLILEKQKLIAMQFHLQCSENKHTDLKVSSDWPFSLPLYLPQPLMTDRDAVQQWTLKHLEEMSQHRSRAAAAAVAAPVHFLPDLVPSIDCYKYNNIRPPYTYAYLIRWSILESPDKQRTLNEIYTWFTTMFFYFRHNTATWKNAVRHNLSLHKCFVRVEGGKGAVWTVDEAEYRRRKGQKYHRDCPVKWLRSFSHHCPEEQ